MSTAISTPDLSVAEGRYLRTKPWGHQVDAINFLRSVLRSEVNGDGGGAMLAMGLGTGKSLVGVSMALNLPVNSVLIAAPLRVVPVWPQQFERHSAFPGPLRVVALDGDAGSVAQKTKHIESRMASAMRLGERIVVIANYETLWRDPFRTWALDRKWGLVILDESHRIKMPSGKASMFCANLRRRAVWRIALSGTPLPHSPLDIYAQFRFLAPQILGTNYHAFKQTYAVLGGFQQRQIVGFRNLDRLEEKMRAIMFRVGKDVLDLPEETHVTYHCDLTPAGARVYRQLEVDFTAGIQNGTVTAANAMVKLLRLQQITGGHATLDGTGSLVEVDDSKAKLLADTLEDIAPEEPVVVWCRFHADLDRVRAVGEATGRTVYEISGRKDEVGGKWRPAAQSPMLVAQIDSGGEGIDCTVARYNFYYSTGFSLGKYSQSLARVHRPGQTRPVTHIHLVARGTVDEKVMRALEKREEVVESILSQVKRGAAQ